MRAIAIANQKGGAGKTTAAVNLAAALGRSRRVLVIDFDPQANASRWLGTKDGGSGLLEVLTDGRNLAETVLATGIPGVDLIPSSAWLRRADRSLAAEPGAETIFRRAVAKLPHRWDLILVDCSPWLGLLTISALTACSEILIPVEASTMATEGLRDLMTTVDKIREGLNPSLRPLAILPGRVDERRAIDCETVDSIRRHFPKLVTKQVIHESARLKEAASHGQPIETYAPSSRAAKEFRAIASEISRRS
jgi:chromosome partitioning protein